MEPDDPEWHKALKDAPDLYEVHTTFRRYATEKEGKTVYRQRVTGRKVVANGKVLFAQHESSWWPKD